MVVVSSSLLHTTYPYMILEAAERGKRERREEGDSAGAKLELARWYWWQSGRRRISAICHIFGRRLHFRTEAKHVCIF